MSDQPDAQYTHTTLNDRVKQAFTLTDDDIDANREGRLSALQLERLSQDRKAFGRCGCIALVGMVAVGWIMATGLLSYMKEPGDRIYDRQDPGLMILCGVALAGLFGLSALASMTEDIRNRKVLSIHGAIECKIVYIKGEENHYRVSLGRQSFAIPRNIYDAFVDGESYRLYYTPSSEILMAAEYDPGPIPTPKEASSLRSNPLTSS